MFMALLRILITEIGTDNYLFKSVIRIIRVSPYCDYGQFGLFLRSNKIKLNPNVTPQKMQGNFLALWRILIAEIRIEINMWCI